MGLEQSTMLGEAGASLAPTTKPNKIKRYNHFHSKPSHVIDLIVNQDWQKLIIATKTHQKEIYVAQKVRLFGVDRKVLPIHLACAMSPPSAVIEALLNADHGGSTVKTPMKNYKKKANRNKTFTGGQNASSRKLEVSQQFNPPKGGKDKNGSNSNSIETDEVDDQPSLTPTTDPLSSFDNDEVTFSGSFESWNKDTSSNFFFPAHKQDYALQITPSGDVRQISPHGYFRKSTNDSESPFVYSSQPDEVSPSSLSNQADEFLPLHIACLFKASPAVINLLIKAYPKAVECKNKWGMLPIHIICANVAMDTPKVAAKKAVDDFTARRYLNNLVAETISDIDDTWEINKVVEILVNAYPQSLNVSSDNAEWLTPVEYIGKNFNGCERDQLLNILKEKLNMATEEAVSHTVSYLHAGSSSARNPQAIQRTMLYSYLKMKDWDGANQQLQQCPDEASCWVIDKEFESSDAFHLPLHLACSYKAPVSLIRLLSQTYPDGVKARGKNGFNPLHIACKKRLSEEIILDFVSGCPQAASQKDEFGRIPLHHACKSNLSLAIMEALIQAYPESCAVKDYNGHTALTYFCSDYERNSASHDQATALFERYGGLILQSDGLPDDNTKN